MKILRVSVRKIVELVLRCGDIDSRYADASAMFEGARAHRMLQKQMSQDFGENYRKEVSLKMDTAMGGIPVRLYGRADGIITDDGGIIIDEIKTTTLTLGQIFEQREMHLSQAKCYAVMLLETLEAPPEKIGVQLTYHQLETGETKRHMLSFTVAELNNFFEDLKDRYGAWLLFERDFGEEREKSVKALTFPFEGYRRGQREMAVSVYRAIERRKRLYVQAPTGIGKTMSALFPAIKAIGENEAEKLFYLTAKTVTRAVAEDAMRLMFKNGLRFKSLTLRAKDKICFKDETICNPDACEYAKGHYDRVNGALLDLLYNNDLIVPNVIEKYAENHRVCPYEFSLDAALWADLVICDYNYVFDPIVYLRRFFSDTDNDYVFLIDEAHNLSERVREMYTAVLRKSDFKELKSALKDKNATAKRLRSCITKVTKHMDTMGGDCVTAEPDADFALAVKAFSVAAEEWLAYERHNTHALHKNVLGQYFESLAFLNVSDIYDERYTTIVETIRRDVCVTLFCLDPSKIIGEKLGLAKSSALFSATLTPLAYYREILGGREEDVVLPLPSPFDQDRLLLLAHCGISTKYADRQGSITPVAEAIYLAVTRKSGNYMVFLPSYEYLSQVYGAFADKYPDIRAIIQQSKMDEDARAEFLSRFDTGGSETLVGFCVLGGIFSEGIDLKGERLIGSIIVGVGLPKISLRQDLIRDYFNAKNIDGYDYAYIFPGMNKVLQAAGRVIRSESDYGVVLLIDTRFATTKYRGLYPSFWSDLRMLKSNIELDSNMEKFTYFK